MSFLHVKIWTKNNAHLVLINACIITHFELGLHFVIILGDVSNMVCAVLEVPRRHDEAKVKFHLKWVLWWHEIPKVGPVGTRNS